MKTQEKPVVLIADDSRVVRVSLKNILKNDCQVIEAEDGQEAWEQLLETPDIRLIFSDLGMPRLDGREFLQKIRNSEITRVRNIPFIVVTGNEEDSGARDELQDLGATEVVSKPFDPARIVSFVSTLTAPQETESYMLLPEQEAQSQFIPNVLNQQDFMQTASKELSFAIRNKNELAIALLRIDQFDQLASHYSGPAIEHILLTTTDVISNHIHPDDTMAYFGDGLFAMLRPASNAIGTRYIGRRVIEDLAAKQFYLGESDDLVTASIGISAPHIRPGIRLRELLLLAEGRLKAAIDLGGNRVVDKGNDTLTPVGLASDSVTGQSSDSPSELQNDSLLSSHLKVDSVLAHIDAPTRLDTQELEDRIQQLESRVEGLTHEKKDLEGLVERLRKQSGDSEQFRQRVFELESEQQQMQLKLNEFVEDNERLRKRASEAESSLEQIQDKGQEEHLTLQQANQFYEQENLRLEGQIEALDSRAQKAELAYRKSEQLVISLKDNIKLLRAQMEQVQQQLVESQQQQVDQQVSEPLDQALEETVDEEETYIEQRTDSELMIDGFPTSKPVADLKPEAAPVVQLFAEPSEFQKPESAADKPASKPPLQEHFEAPKPQAEPVKPDISIPVYRAPEREGPFKERKPLSSFAIASLILLALVIAGIGYVYFAWDEEPGDPTAGTLTGPAEASPETTPVEPAVAAKPARIVPVKPSSSVVRSAPVSAERSTTASQPQTSSPPVPEAAVSPAPTDLADEEARLQAELTLRQIAEEEFQQRLKASADSPPEGSGIPAMAPTEVVPESPQTAISVESDLTGEPASQVPSPQPEAVPGEAPAAAQPLEAAGSASTE